MANILVIDDDDIILKTVRAALVKAGHMVVTAKDAHSGRESAAADNFHLVITDVNLPHGTNGFMLVKMLRDSEKTAKIPMLIMSVRRSEADVLKGIEAGVDDYVIKPIDFDILMTKVNSLLSRGDHASTISRIQSKGTLTMAVPMDIVGISEEGLQFLSAIELEANSKVQLDSKLFEAIGINKPNLRVAHCEKLETEHPSFAIKVNFIGLTAGEQQKIRLYSNRSRIKPKE